MPRGFAEYSRAAAAACAAEPLAEFLMARWLWTCQIRDFHGRCAWTGILRATFRCVDAKSEALIVPRIHRRLRLGIGRGRLFGNLIGARKALEDFERDVDVRVGGEFGEALGAFAKGLVGIALF